MTHTLRARSTPYRPTLRACDRICKRCGIQFTIHPQRDRHHTECRDCR
jgi:pyridoxine 5'-phosphate synthase PdxJ